jgi:hypothetical protein
VIDMRAESRAERPYIPTGYAARNPMTIEASERQRQPLQESG